ncbi:ABC transporter permease [Streptomyces sp. NBC_00083]|uniref:ABC transporter permease n=1 Tax=Streptomyces sp. NBC_00083 TaxID=2975647 RepID=UPI0022566E2E|nr:FtsX-like permease family protein [Streptomyces sp. NBC_00083]MCX5384555.1 FtsX-like permease family protein [Streptomyces sp. NBC_00083]
MLRTALRNVLAHKTRLIMTVLSVCLGVAFISGSLVFADSTTSAHRAAMSRDSADIAVSVGPKSVPGASPKEQYAALDDTLVRRLSQVPGVAAARPTADGTVTLAAKDGTPMRADTAMGKFGAGYLPGPDGKDSRYPLTEGRAPAGADEIALDRGTAKAAGYRLGDAVTLAGDGPVLTPRLVGLVSTTDSRVNAGGTLAVFDRATAQKLFAAPGRYTGIDLTAAPGTSQSELSDRVTALLPTDHAEAVTAGARAAQQSLYIGARIKSYERLPLLFAAVSLFIGTFLIVNTFTMVIARRTREIALLRAIGATRRQVVRSVLAEATLVGLAASALGFVLGLGVATVLPQLLDSSGDLLPSGPLVVGPMPVIASLVAGVGVTVLAAWLPSRGAARIAPVEALRTADQPPSPALSRIRGAVGLALLVLGAGLLISLSDAVGATDANLQTALLGCGILVVALILLAPLLAGPVIRLLGRLVARFGAAGDLARENTLRNPRRTAATAAALMISTALVSGLAVIDHSTNRALDSQAAAGLSADCIISTRTSTTAIDSAAVRRVAAVPGVRTASAVADSTITPGGKQISGVDPRTVGEVMKLRFVSGSVTDIGPGRIAVSRGYAAEHHLATGMPLDASIGAGDHDQRYTVVGVYEDNPTAQDVLGYRADVQNHAYLRDSVQRLLVRTDDGTLSAGLEEQLRAAVGNSPLLTVQSRGQLVRAQAGTAGELMTMVMGLLAIGVLISTLGMVNTLAMSVSERTREIGVLRAIGMDRPAVRTMIRLEAVCVAAFGTLLGLAGGLFGAWKVSGLANGAIPQYSFSLPWGTLALVVALGLAVGTVAAAVPARRAARLGPLEAVARA